MKRPDHKTRDRRFKSGTTIVEATIVLPLMLMLIFGIAEFGISYTRWNSLNNAVREGARVGVVFRTPCVAGTVTNLVETTVADFVDNTGIDVANLTTTVTGACGGTGTPLTVHATVPFNYIALDVLSSVAPSTNLVAQTVMRNE